ncbi:hypothetical protein BN1708_009325 [Verticillium longisporum]|uniref:Uncharacterized protein n=1 Tax=Verticillium longisporum TaxID=100787 RepID=A0A0G4KG79_VERLO|nr:hypothetical protein BN1708_009325 [Verticillium longisporum]
MATPRAMSSDELLSSPDPLNASRDGSFLPSSRRVTRSASQVSHRYMSLGTSNSPRKQTIAVEIGSAKTPQRLFVTLETENDDQNRIARTLFPSSTPARRSRRKSTAATTKSVPLRDEDAPGAITPKRRGRGKRNSTPMKQTPGRSKRAKITETDDSESDATSRPAPASAAGRKKTSATPKKRAATPKKTATSQKKTPQRRSARILDLEEETMSDATVLSELSNITTRQSKKRKAQTAPDEDTSSSKQSTKRATGKAHRMALIPEEIERIAEPVLDSVENVHAEENTRTEPIAEEPATEPAASLVYEPQTSEDPLTSDAIVDNTATTRITAGAPTEEASTESWISGRRSSTPVEDNGWDAQHSIQQEEPESKPDTESIDQNDATARVASSQEPTPQDQSMMQVESGIQNGLEDEQHVQPQASEQQHEQQEEEKEAAPEPDMWLAMSDAAGGPPSDFSDDAPPDDGPDDHSDINDDAAAETVADQFSDDDEAAARPALDDTVAQGEDFSMIFAASIPSLRGSLGVRPNETMEFGEETSFIISQTLESFRKSRAGEETAAQNEGSPDLSYDHSRVLQEQRNGRDDDRDEVRRDDVQDVESNQADQDEAQGDSTNVDDLPVLPVLSQQAPTTSQAQLDLNSEWSEAPDEVLEAAVPREHEQGGDERSPIKRYRPAARISSPEMSALYEDPFLDIAEKQAAAQAPSSLARRLFSSSRKLQSQTAASSPAEPTPRPLARQSLARQVLSSAQKSMDVDSSPVRSVADEDEFPEVPDNVLAALTPAKSQYLWSNKPSASGSAAKSPATKATSLGNTLEMTDAESAASPSGSVRGRSALSPAKRHLSPSLARSSPRRKPVSLSRQLFNSKVQEARHADIDHNVDAIPIELTGKATPNVDTDHDESAAYNDSWSEIPEDVLDAAVPGWYLAQRKAEERAKNTHDLEKDTFDQGAHDASLMDEEDDEDVQNVGSVEDRVGEDDNLSENDMQEELSEEEAFEEDIQDEDEKEEARDDAQMDDVDDNSAHDDMATEGNTTQKDIAAASSPRSRAASVASTQGRLPTPEFTSSPLDSTVISHHDRHGTAQEPAAAEPAAGDTLPELPAATSKARPTLDVLVTEPEARQKSTPTAPELSSQRTSQDANMLAPRSASAELGHRPSLSPIVNPSRHHPYVKARPVVPSPWTKAGKENEPLGDEVTGLTPAKAQAAEAARSVQKSAQSSRQNKMLSFFSSPALLPGMENAQAALERKRRDLAAQEEAANRSAESPIHVLQTSNTMFPTVPFKSANPFANARAPAPSSLRKSVLAPSTPDRSQVQSRGKSTQKSLGVSKLSFAPTQSATPVRTHLSHADIEKWQEDSALEESSSSPDHRLRFLRTLPPKNASPSKSAMRSPLKAHTPGPVVEWDSGVESPMTQAQKRFERELEQAAVDDFARRQWEAQHSATRKSLSRQRTVSEVATHDDEVSNEDVNEEDARQELVGDDDNNVEMIDAPSVETEEELSSSPPRTQLASNQPRESSQQRGLSIELELQLQRERMEQYALERQEALRRQKEEIELANQQRLEEEKRAKELKEIERERYRKQAVAEWDQPLSRTVWGDTHYRYMHRLIKMRRKGPFNYVFPEDFERRTGWLMGQTVLAHDETQQTLVLNAWHLNVIDVFMSEVKGVWDELELAIRLFSIVVMERLREEWHLPLDEIRKAMVAQRAALAAQAEAAANAQEVAEDDYEDDEEYSGV